MTRRGLFRFIPGVAAAPLAAKPTGRTVRVIEHTQWDCAECGGMMTVAIAGDFGEHSGSLRRLMCVGQNCTQRHKIFARPIVSAEMPVVGEYPEPTDREKDRIVREYLALMRQGKT